MATLEKLEEALRNADAAGDAAAARQLADAVRYHPEYGMSGAEKFAVGAGASLDKAVRGVSQLFGADTSQGDADAQVYQENRPGGWQTKAGEVTGDVAAMAPAALVPGGVLAQMAVAGGMGAAMTPGDAAERAQAAAWGAGGAGVAGAVAKGLSRVAKPIGVESATQMSGGVQDAMQGVERTLGQQMAHRGSLAGKVLNRAEEWAADAPIVGGPLRESRAAAESAIAKRGPSIFERTLADTPAPHEATHYRPSLVRLAEDLPVTKMERDQAHGLLVDLRRRYMGNPSGERPSALAAHGLERELRAAAEGASKESPAYGKLLTRMADEYSQTWRAAVGEADRYHLSGLDYQMSEAARKAAQKVPEDTLGKVMRSVRSHGIPGLGALVVGGPMGTAAAAGGAYLYGKRAVQDYLTGRLARTKQQAIAKALREGARPAAAAGAGVGYGIPDDE